MSKRSNIDIFLYDDGKTSKEVWKVSQNTEKRLDLLKKKNFLNMKSHLTFRTKCLLGFHPSMFFQEYFKSLKPLENSTISFVVLKPLEGGIDRT